MEDALLIVADWHWRRGPRWKAILAWAFGRREVFRTHLGDVAEISWWRGDPFLIDLEGDEA
ncbi:hypothetical protein vBPeaSP1_025 [Pelagibaca phage vB_PeaS-P1]|uniref:Uncharacterized protein n=1 Tax=Salipiger abyssi TaxID=1250539 RepID=A0A1P8UXL5_9RHOB|nr:hypothetical protein vBPeaSP1_025 [Pelagibaca phage vB_PeaS-P1]APZ54131.1 hypothetical protein Ga0080574_TMP3797 [Salipiger abyssi]